jgi:hypothetical protein
VDDVGVLFVAGHGLRDIDGYIFATHDVDFAAPAARGMSFEDLEGLLDGVASRQKLMLVDTCHAGEADDDGSTLASAGALAGVQVRSINTRGLKKTDIRISSTQRLLEDTFADVRRRNGAHVIVSAGGSEFAADGGDWKNGVFTYAVREALGGGRGDGNADGTVTVSEMTDYVVKRVRELTNGVQSPAARRESIVNDFVLY